ncbi:MAG TPA: DNA repair and recombination protein RadB [Thermoplasmata archaeon]|nr:DNA repair and recombination protein RadB [Thermoplasmata archaeon]
MMRHLVLECKPLDNLLGGGIDYGGITEIYGVEGSGKTNLCLQAFKRYVPNKRVAWIYTEKFSTERFKQLVGGSDYRKTHRKLLGYNCSSLKEQVETIKRISKLNSIGLLIVDSINAWYRVELEKNKESVQRSFINQLEELELMANERNIPVIITSQVYENEQSIQPFAGKRIGMFAKSILKLEKLERGVRKATLMKHRVNPKGMSCLFRISAEGLVEV